MSPTVLTSNGRPIPNTLHYFGSLAETNWRDGDGGCFRSRCIRDGYVLVRQAVPADVIGELRQAYFSKFDSTMFKDGDARRGKFSGQLPPNLPCHGLPGHPAHAFVRTHEFRAFLDLPFFRHIAETILGAAVKRVRRTPIRHFIRGSSLASRAHCDRSYLDCEPDASVTLWVPLGDCPIEAGGIVYLEGSHKDAALGSIARQGAPTDRPDDERPLTHDLKWLAEKTRRRWLAADFAAGDVVAHSPSIVHATIDPMIDLMRLSTDIRFVRQDVPIDPRWEGEWSADDGF